MAENFDIAKFLKENSLGSYGILGKYVDLQPLKEVDKESEYNDGKDNQYDGRYDDESGPAIANENKEQEGFDRIMGLIDQSLVSKLPLLKKVVDKARAKGLADSSIFNMLSTNSLVANSINYLIDDGFEYHEIVDFFGKDFSANEEVSVSSSGVEMEEEIDMNEYDQLLGAIESLLSQGESEANILTVVKDTLGMNEGMNKDADYTSAEEFDLEPQEGPNDPLGPNMAKYPRADFADAVYAANQAGISKDELIRLINQNAR